MRLIVQIDSADELLGHGKFIAFSEVRMLRSEIDKPMEYFAPLLEKLLEAARLQFKERVKEVSGG